MNTMSVSAHCLKKVSRSQPKESEAKQTGILSVLRTQSLEMTEWLEFEEQYWRGESLQRD